MKTIAPRKNIIKFTRNTNKEKNLKVEKKKDMVGI